MEKLKYSNAIIENVLNDFEPLFGPDFFKYKNHVYRVYFNCKFLDEDLDNEDKYAIASVFHDIGIWTNGTFDYLEPSILQAKKYLCAIDKDDWNDEISSMINWHHKLTIYNSGDSELVENFRKADWMDVTFGLFNFGIKRNKLVEVRKDYPPVGFHFFLLKSAFKYFLKKPADPLPMFKR